MLIRNLLKSSLRLAGVIANNEEPSAEDFATAQESMSSLLSIWSTNPSLVWSKTTTVYPITSSASTVTLSAKPLRILSVTFEYATNNMSYIVEEVDDTEFQRTSYKNIGIPTKFVWDGNVTLKLIGRGTGNLNVVTQSSIADFTANIDSNTDLPIGYDAAIKFNTALLLCEEFGKAPSQVLISLATDSYNAIKSQNKRPAISRPDITNAFGSNTSYINSGIVR